MLKVYVKAFPEQAARIMRSLCTIPFCCSAPRREGILWMFFGALVPLVASLVMLQMLWSPMAVLRPWAWALPLAAFALLSACLVPARSLRPAIARVHVARCASVFMTRLWALVAAGLAPFWLVLPLSVAAGGCVGIVGVHASVCMVLSLAAGFFYQLAYCGVLQVWGEGRSPAIAPLAKVDGLLWTGMALPGIAMAISCFVLGPLLGYFPLLEGLDIFIRIVAGKARHPRALAIVVCACLTLSSLLRLRILSLGCCAVAEDVNQEDEK